jgi:hypothetical protein
MIDRLEAAELVERRPDPDDRRARRLYLRPAAESTLSTLKKTGDEIMLSALAGLDEHEMDVATAVLERLRASFQAASQSGHGAEAPRADDVARPAAPDRLGRLQHVG